MKFFTALNRIFALCFFCCLVSLPDASCQDFSSIDRDLMILENLIADTISNTEEQQKLLDSLRASLNESGILIAGYESTIQQQENLLKDLRERLSEMSETYRMQSDLSVKYERSLKFWKTFTLVAIPLTAAISGTVVWAVTR